MTCQLWSVWQNTNCVAKIANNAIIEVGLYTTTVCRSIPDRAAPLINIRHSGLPLCHSPKSRHPTHMQLIKLKHSNSMNSDVRLFPLRVRFEMQISYLSLTFLLSFISVNIACTLHVLLNMLQGSRKRREKKLINFFYKKRKMIRVGNKKSEHPFAVRFLPKLASLQCIILNIFIFSVIFHYCHRAKRWPTKKFKMQSSLKIKSDARGFWERKRESIKARFYSWLNKDLIEIYSLLQQGGEKRISTDKFSAMWIFLAC